jgi:anti-anti-sigma regulatory factor
VGLFSIFKKKADDEPELPELPRRPSGGETTRMPRDIDAERARQRDIARATAAKIDAIEYAMTFDIFNGPDTAFANGAAPATAAAAAAGAEPPPASLNSGLNTLTDDIEPTLLLPDDDVAAPAVSAAAEESAILYANGQQDAAAHLLHDAVHGADGGDRQLWAMLFDLYQLSGNQAGFESLAIDFASRFETSPPSWIAPAPARPVRRSGPSATLAGSLDDQCAATIDALLAQAPGNSTLQLDVSGVSFINGDACAHLLAALERLRELDVELVLVGAEPLMRAIEARTQVGQRGSGPAPWLLLLALLQLTAQDEAFDQVAMDYCITFEVSPPSYVAPARVTIAGAPDELAVPERYVLPAVLDHSMLDLIAAHAALADAVEFDCSALARADYGAATALLGQLRAIQADGRDIAFHELNHLVAALFRLIGIDGVARLHTRKY